MTASLFIDSNVLVYAHQRADDPRCDRARELLAAVGQGFSTRLSAQVIAEFISVITRKTPVRLSRAEAVDLSREMISLIALTPLDEVTTREALRACDRYGLDFYDAQIWAAARVSGCDVILTEDTHGDAIEGIAYVNPFAERFDVDAFLAEYR